MSGTKAIATAAMWLLAILIGGTLGAAVAARGVGTIILAILGGLWICLFVYWWTDYQRDFPDA